MFNIKKPYRSFTNIFIIIGLLFLINYFFSATFFRLDLSKDQLHNLSTYTKDQLLQLEDYITIDVYLVGDFPAEIEKLKTGLKEKLEELKAYSGDNLKINYRNLDEDPDLAKDFKNQVIQEGVNPSDIIITRDNKQEIIRVWPGLILRKGNDIEPIQLLQPGSYPITQTIINQFNDQLEYLIVSGFKKLIDPSTKNIRFLRGHNELDNADAWVIRDQLMNFYDIDTVRIKQIKTDYYNLSIDKANHQYDSLVKNNIDSIIISKRMVPVLDENGLGHKGTKRYLKNYLKNNILNEFRKDPIKCSERLNSLDDTDLLIIAKPTKSFTEKEKFVVDQYIMNGGRVIWLIDMFDVDESVLKDTSFTFAHPVDHQLQYQLFRYEARFNSNIITDSRCSPIVREDGLGRIPKWFFYPLLYNDNIYLKNVGPIKTRYTSSVDMVGEDNLERTPLLTTSTKYKTLRQTTINYQNLFNYDPENFEIDVTKTPPTIGWLIEGVFQSNYQNRSINDDFQKFISNPNVKFKTESSPTKMVFIGDGDLIRNDFIKNNNQIKPVSLSFESADYGTPDFFPRYGNAVFFLNVVDQLLDRGELIPLRSKMNSPRLLKKDIYNEKSFWQFVNILVPILIVFVFSLINLLIRRSKYAN